MKTQQLKQLKNQKGQAMLITMLILMSSFLVSMALGGLVLYELKSMIFTGESVKALYAAESGLEWKLYQANHPDEETGRGPIMNNGTSFIVSVSSTTEGYLVIYSVGRSINTYRALEVMY
ncbi:MAG TPA: hypothetical protein PLR11_01375 [Candidatus Paceibacterota bacterium]|nr:hypothetical protein [Candidatus Paceibacterota bacterium]